MELRRMLVEEQKLDAVVSLPGGVFKPYAGVSTAILLFTKTNSGGTDHVWFYDMQADGWSLDDKRSPLLSEDKLGPVPSAELSEDEHAKNNLPDVLARWQERNYGELKRARTEQSFCVPKADIAAQGYDLSLNRYKEVVHEEVEYRAPKEILESLAKLEAEIQQGMTELGRCWNEWSPDNFARRRLWQKSGSVDPSKFPGEVFDLYSIPAFDSRQPEVVAGKLIGSTKQIVEPGDVLLSKIVPHIRRSWVVGEKQGWRIHRVR